MVNRITLVNTEESVTAQSASELGGLVRRRNRRTNPPTLQQQGCLRSYKKVFIETGISKERFSDGKVCALCWDIKPELIR